MKVKKLFKTDETEVHNELGAAYSQRVMAALRPVIEQAEKDGISMRDLEHVINGDAMLMISGAILRRYGSGKPLTKVKK